MIDNWPKDRVELLIQLNDDGKSAGEIARIFSAKYRQLYTRNAIIGKRIRIGLKSSNPGGRPPVYKPPKRKPQPSLPTIPAPRNKVMAIPIGTRYEPKGQCQYMAGDDYKICGKECHGSWCPEHKALVHVDREKTVSGNNKAAAVARAFRI